MKIVLNFFLTVCLFAATNASAGLIFENDYTDGVSTGQSAWCSGCGSTFRVWDTFTLDDDATITQFDARFWFQNTSSIELSIWTEDRTVQLFAQTFDVSDLTITELGSLTEADAMGEITGLDLSAGTYAISFWDLAEPSSTFAWYAVANPDDNSSFQSDGGSGGGNDMAFRLYADSSIIDDQEEPDEPEDPVVPVPEPPTLLIFTLGVICLMAKRFKLQ